MNKDEMINELMGGGEFKLSALKKLNDGQLTETYKSFKTSKELLDKILEPETTDIIPTSNEGSITEERKDPSDANWTDYVMGLFHEDELDKNSQMPRVDGLRRVALKVFGPYDLIVQDIPQVPCPDNKNRATAIVQIRFHADKRVVTDAADACLDNTTAKFAVHPVAIAITRAEGRALRKALYLVKVLAAEELQGPNGNSNNDNSDLDMVRSTPIKQTMLNSLKMMCDRQKVDLHKLAVNIGYDINTPEELSHKEGIEISNELTRFQQKKKEIPEEVKK